LTKKQFLKAKKTFSSWLTERYLLIIRNEENFAEKRFLGFTYAKFFLIAFLTFSILMIISLFLTRTILAQWFDPRHAQMEANEKLYRMTTKIDSLENAVVQKEQFISIFRGFVGGTIDSTKVAGFNMGSKLSSEELIVDLTTSRIDSQLRSEFENESAQIEVDPIRNSDLQDLFFFSPLSSGYPVRQFSLIDKHYGVDVVAKKNEHVMSIASGTVVLASWTQDSGYVIVIQHGANLISVYKHNAELTKKSGSFVNIGEVIAIVGNSGELTDGPHLHFELWYKGNPVNPEDFVSF